MNLKDRTRWAINYISAKNKLSNPKIAKRLGVKNDTVNSYRAKLSNPKVDFIVKFCDAFDIDLIWFTKGDGEPFPGASIKYPEVCSQTGYEIARKREPEPGRSGVVPAAHGSVAVTGTEENENTTEKNFLRLSELAGIAPERGWKTKLSSFLDISIGQISNSILRDKISKNLMNKIESKGFAREKWSLPDALDAVPVPRASVSPIDVEMSFQKLAILAGIRIGQNWLLDLASLLGLDAMEIRKGIRDNHISEAVLHEIERKGFDPGLWGVRQQVEHAYPDSQQLPAKTNELLEMAARILESGTSFAAAFALSIEAFLKAVETERGVGQQKTLNQG
jgi:transcriptional regulator with XRE-family HTH domain